jgi:hypothetical protein
LHGPTRAGSDSAAAFARYNDWQRQPEYQGEFLITTNVYTVVRQLPQTLRSQGDIVARARGQFVARPWLGGALVALLFLMFTAVVARNVGLPIRDPEGTLGAKMVFPFLILLAFLAVDVVARVVIGKHRSAPGTHWSDAMRDLAVRRWNLSKFGQVIAGFLSFHIIYLCYRNLKSYLPLVTDANWDRMLWNVDKWATFGVGPAKLLHDVLGTGISAHVLSSIYIFYLMFIPVSVGAALMWADHLRHGFWYVTALSLNWILGAASYYVLPSLGPAFFRPDAFASLPNTGVAKLQYWLLEHRSLTLADPLGSGDVQSIAAFASLHISAVFTALLLARRLQRRRMSQALTVYLVLTFLSTVYFGWHYLLDDVAGFAIGWTAVVIAAPLTGHRWKGSPPSGSPAAPVSPAEIQ